jgi:sugar-specific transcriptional regulator TrmB
MENQENILKQAGLSEEQAITYEALIDKGPQKASILANWTGIKRWFEKETGESVVEQHL